MKVNPHIFRAYDIRGIAEPKAQEPADLTEESVYLIGLGTGTYLKQTYNTRNMAVGRDPRTHGEKLKQAFIRGITETGIDVADVGMTPSPMIYWASCTKDFDFDSATNITASHNPKEYNGVKTVAKNAHSICGDDLQEILKIIESPGTVSGATPIFSPGKISEPTPALSTEKIPQPEPTFSPGKISQIDLWPAYKTDLLSKAQLGRPLKVVIDCGNGAAGPYAPELLKAFGCEVIELYCEPDGQFPNHEANPEELKNMQDLITAVKAHQAHLGIGFDGDGDRVGIVDETGHMYSSDFMLLLLARDLATRLPNSPIVFDVKFSQSIINDLEQHGLTPVMSKTGHSFIEKKMKEVKAPLAGEVSGHLFFGENYFGFDDALLAALKIIEILSNSPLPLSQQFANLPKTYTTPEFKAHCPDNKKFAIVKALTEHFTAQYDCITIDGVRVNFAKDPETQKTTAWGAVRASNTSPNLTLRFEAQSPEKLAEIQEIMAKEISKYPEVDLIWHIHNPTSQT